MKKLDLFILGGALLLAGAIYAAVRLFSPAPEGGFAVIYVGDEVFERVALNEYRSITIDQGDGRVNVIRVDRRGIWMESSSCKNQICVAHAPLDPAHADELLFDNWIVCLPNGISIELEGGK